MLADEKKWLQTLITVKAAQANPVCNEIDDDAPFVQYISE